MPTRPLPLSRFMFQTCKFILGGSAVTSSGGVLRMLISMWICCQWMKMGIWYTEIGSFFTNPLRLATRSLLLHILPWLLLKQFQILELEGHFGSKSQSCRAMQQQFWTKARINTKQNLFHKVWSDLGWFHWNTTTVRHFWKHCSLCLIRSCTSNKVITKQEWPFTSVYTPSTQLRRWASH